MGKKIAELRIRKGWSQYRLAKESGIKQGTISNLELGKRVNPQSDTLKRLCEALGVSMSEFDAPADLVSVGISEAEKMPMTEKEKAALERFKAMPSDEQKRRIFEKYNNLSPEQQEAINVIIRSISPTRQ